MTLLIVKENDGITCFDALETKEQIREWNTSPLFKSAYSAKDNDGYSAMVIDVKDSAKSLADFLYWTGARIGKNEDLFNRLDVEYTVII